MGGRPDGGIRIGGEGRGGGGGGGFFFEQKTFCIINKVLSCNHYFCVIGGRPDGGIKVRKVRNSATSAKNISPP